MVGAVFLLGGGSGENDQTTEPETAADPTAHLSLLKISNMDGLENYAAANEMTLQSAEDASLTCIGNIPLLGQRLTLYFQAGEDGNLTRTDGMMSIALSEKTESCLKMVFSEICYGAALLFNISGDFTYSIYSNEGYALDAAAEESFQQILAGQAKFGLSAVDYDGTYWNATACLDENAVLQLSFFHSFDAGLYETGVENIMLAVPTGSEE